MCALAFTHSLAVTHTHTHTRTCVRFLAFYPIDVLTEAFLPCQTKENLTVDHHRVLAQALRGLDSVMVVARAYAAAKRNRH